MGNANIRNFKTKLGSWVTELQAEPDETAMYLESASIIPWPSIFSKAILEIQDQLDKGGIIYFKDRKLRIKTINYDVSQRYLAGWKDKEPVFLNSDNQFTTAKEEEAVKVPFWIVQTPCSDDPVLHLELVW